MISSGKLFQVLTVLCKKNCIVQLQPCLTNFGECPVGSAYVISKKSFMCYYQISPQSSGFRSCQMRFIPSDLITFIL
jgi:hypothetical protein